MKFLGFLGSPQLNGTCSKLLKKALEGAEHSAETKGQANKPIGFLR